MLRTYSDFLAAADSLGVLAFSGRFLDGFPRLDMLTSPSQWHTGDPETDPWLWKDRAAAERAVAFGNILGGRKGFVSRGMYRLFFSACRPQQGVEERYWRGELPRTVLEVYHLFKQEPALDTAQIRSLMGARKGAGASAVDSAVVALQKEYYITICGNRRKVGSDGREYGWPANLYCLVEDWAPDLLEGGRLPADEARELILEHLRKLSGKIDAARASKLLFGRNTA